MIYMVIQLLNILLKAYKLHVDLDSVDGNVVRNLRVTEGNFIYNFGDVTVTVNSCNIIKKFLDIEFVTYGTTIHIVTNPLSITITDINLETIKEIIGPDDIISHWTSEGSFDINIGDELTVTGNLTLTNHGPHEYDMYNAIKALSDRNHLGKDWDMQERELTSIIRTEDMQFYEHPGLAWRNILSSIEVNHRTQKVLKGGSSLTCQLARNCWLGKEKTFHRKIQEAFIALLMEQYYKIPKKSILALYLQMIEMAPGVYGLNDGALHYFGRPISELEDYELHTLQYFIPRPLFVPEAININSLKFRNRLRMFLVAVYNEQPKVIKFAPPYQHIYL